MIRSIPAWAGETVALIGSARDVGVYPRVGGGNHRVLAHRLHNRGLSPRGRGKPLSQAPRTRHRGSIPAWAGETRIISSMCGASAVYPRVGGGNFTRNALRLFPPGLSPRGRGKLPARHCGRRTDRSIPAWAGETAATAFIAFSTAVYPRVGGGNSGNAFGIIASAGLSPRGRGKRDAAKPPLTAVRSIPAWAGETAADCA